jgi:hypothetical protein
MQLESRFLTALLLVAAILVLWAAISLSKRLFGRSIDKAASATRTSIDDLVVDLLRRTGLAASVVIVLGVAPAVLHVPTEWNGTLRVAWIRALMSRSACRISFSSTASCATTAACASAASASS